MLLEFAGEPLQASAGGSDERPPEALDAAIIFAPAGKVHRSTQMDTDP